MSKKLPFVSSDIPRDLRIYLDRVREAIDGAGANKLVTVGDLVSSGVAGTTAGGALAPAVPIASTPMTPTGLEANGAIKNIILTWDDPLYSGHAYAEIWAAATDDFSLAVQVGMAPGSIYTDPVGPGIVRYYWIRFVNVLGVQGAFNAIAGTRGETGQDVEYLLNILTGQLTEEQLYSDLGARIDLIDGVGPGSVDARISVEADARTTADSALSSQITTVAATTTTTAAALQTEITTRAAADSALSSSITTLQATVDSNTTAIQTEATARASADGTLFAQYTVKIDTNGYVSGYGLASTSSGATPTSTFAVRADSFYIASPSGPGVAPAMPFIVRTTATTINGETVPAGVYMTDGFIQNGTITNAKIGDAAIDNAKIANLSASKITAGSISTGAYIQSTSFISGTQGWRISGNGTAEFGAASIRGLITAAQIDSRGLSIKDASGNTILSAGTPLSTSYISGLGSLATQSSVNWNTQISNIPAFGNFAYLSSITSANISTYIEAAAIGTAYISNLAVTTGKIADLAVSNAKLDNLAVTTAKINDLAVTTGKINDLAVSTLKIASQAVTFPQSAYTNGFTSGYGEIQVQSLTVSATGAPALLIFGAHVYSDVHENLYVKLTRNGSTVFQVGPGPDYNKKVRGEGMETATIIDNPGAGTHTYQLYVGSGSNYVSSQSRCISYLEVKR